MPMLRLSGGPHDGEDLYCEREPAVLMAGLPPDEDEQSPDHVIRAAYLRDPETGRYHFLGWRSRHEVRALYGSAYYDQA